MKSLKTISKDWMFLNKLGFAILIVGGVLTVVFKIVGITQNISRYDVMLIWTCIGFAMNPLVGKLRKNNNGLLTWKLIDWLGIALAGIIYFSLYISPSFVMWLLFPWAKDFIDPTIEAYILVFGFAYAFLLFMIGAKISADVNEINKE